MTAGPPELPDRPQLLASTGPLLLSPLGWVLDAIADAGFTGAEVLFTHNPETRDPEKIHGYAVEAGIEVPVVHGPYMVLLRTVLGSAYQGKTRRALELAADIGARIMVAHAPLVWERRGRGWLASGEADAEAAELGVAFGMENLYPALGRSISTVITPEDMTAFPDVVFDTSHFGVAGIDLFTAWDVLADRVVHLHVSDNFGNGKDSHAPIGSGVLPLERFLAHVGASGYRGTITLELDVRAYLDTRETLVTFLARERAKAEALLLGEGLDPAVKPEPLRT
jgi:sugar phosphate isomerase/epimerase